MARIRRGALKGSGKKGYYNFLPQDPRVHKESGLGMKQPQIPLGADGDALPAIRKGRKIAKAKPEPTYSDEAREIIDKFDEETLKKFLEETGFDADDIRNIREGDYNDLEVEIGNETWRIFESEEDAERMAEDRVRDDLENEPDNFNQDWLQNHISISETYKNIIAGEEADNLVDEVMDEDQLLEEARVKDEADELEDEINDLTDQQMSLDPEKMNKDDAPYKKLDEQIKKLESEKEELIDKAREDVRSSKYDEIHDALDDPIQYFVEEQGLYSREDLLKQSFISIDIDAATEDAIATDGWQHFLASYDGNSTELPNGRVMIREN